MSILMSGAKIHTKTELQTFFLQLKCSIEKPQNFQKTNECGRMGLNKCIQHTILFFSFKFKKKIHFSHCNEEDS